MTEKKVVLSRRLGAQAFLLAQEIQSEPAAQAVQVTALEAMMLAKGVLAAQPALVVMVPQAQSQLVSHLD